MSQSTLSKLKPLNAAQRTELHARQAAFHTQAEPPQQKSKISPKEPPSLWRLVTEPEMSNNILREIKEQIGPQYLISNFESFIPAVITQKEWEKSAVRLETYTGDIFDTLKDITDGKISLYELSSNPELQAKIRKEMMEVEPELIDLLLDYPLSGTSISPQDLHGTIYQKTEDIAGMPDRLELLTSVEKLVSYLAIQRSCHNFQNLLSEISKHTNILMKHPLHNEAKPYLHLIAKAFQKFQHRVDDTEDRLLDMTEALLPQNALSFLQNLGGDEQTIGIDTTQEGLESAINDLRSEVSHYTKSMYYINRFGSNTTPQQILADYYEHLLFSVKHDDTKIEAVMDSIFNTNTPLRKEYKNDAIDGLAYMLTHKPIKGHEPNGLMQFFALYPKKLCYMLDKLPDDILPDLFLYDDEQPSSSVLFDILNGGNIGLLERINRIYNVGDSIKIALELQVTNGKAFISFAQYLAEHVDRDDIVSSLSDFLYKRDFEEFFPAPAKKHLPAKGSISTKSCYNLQALQDFEDEGNATSPPTSKRGSSANSTDTYLAVDLLGGDADAVEL